MKLLRLLALLPILIAPAYGQGVGQLSPGYIWGNATSEKGPAGPSTVTSILDRALNCSANGLTLNRMSGSWGCTGSPTFSGAVTIGGITAQDNGNNVLVLNSGKYYGVQSSGGIQVGTDIDGPIIGTDNFDTVTVTGKYPTSTETNLTVQPPMIGGNAFVSINSQSGSTEQRFVVGAYGPADSYRFFQATGGAGAYLPVIFYGSGVTESFRINAATDNSVFFTQPVSLGVNNLHGASLLSISKDANIGADSNAAQVQISGGTTNLDHRLLLGYDTTNGRGYIQAATVGSSYDPLYINQGGGLVTMGPGGLAVTSTTASTSTTTGALTVPNGGVGIGGALNVGGKINGSSVIPLMAYANGVDIGNGVADAGPAFRAATAACLSGMGFRTVSVPVPSVGYLLKTLDASGLGALVIGDGTNPNSCTYVSEGVNTWGDYRGGVNIKLGDGLNRPLIYVANAASSPSFNGFRFDGSGSTQTGWTGGPGGKLYVIQVADGSASPEGSIWLSNSYVLGGYNGGIYIGSGRGTTFFNNVWCQYYGQSGSADYCAYFNGYDANLEGFQVGPMNTGGIGAGVFFAEGSQYWMSNSAIFMNYVGEIVNNHVGYITHSNVNYQWNAANGIVSNGGAPYTGGSPVQSHVWTNATFDGNSHASSGTYSDFLAVGDAYASLVAPTFAGNTSTIAGPLPKYNIETSGSSAVAIAAPVYSATSHTNAFTNDFSKVVTNQPGGVNFGNIAPPGGVSGSTASFNTSNQFGGTLWTNGFVTTASITGSTAANDGGVFSAFLGGNYTALIGTSGGNHVLTLAPLQLGEPSGSTAPLAAYTGSIAFANAAGAALTSLQGGAASVARTWTLPVDFGSANCVLRDTAGNGQLSCSAVVAPAGTLTGSTLASGVTSSSLTSVGTITSGAWNAGAVTSSAAVTAATTLKSGAVAVASLPTCNSAAEGTHYGVTDANATTFHTVVAGGGTNHVGVYCNGTSWFIGG